jgi:hypothetical protein
MGWKDLVSVILLTGWGLVPPVSGMVHWLTHKILLSSSFSWWLPPSHPISIVLVLNSTITSEREAKSLLPIPPCHDEESPPSTAYTVYCFIPWSTFSRSQPVSYRLADLDCTQFSTFPQLRVNTWIESQLPSRLPPSQTTASRLTAS